MILGSFARATKGQMVAIMAELVTIFNLHVWSPIISSSPLGNFRDPASAVFAAAKTCLRPALHENIPRRRNVFYSVRRTGLEPARPLGAHPPQGCVSTNFTTCAVLVF